MLKKDNLWSADTEQPILFSPVSQERVEPVRTEPKNEPAKPASHPKEMTEVINVYGIF